MLRVSVRTRYFASQFARDASHLSSHAILRVSETRSIASLRTHQNTLQELRGRLRREASRLYESIINTLQELIGRLRREASRLYESIKTPYKN